MSYRWGEEGRAYDSAIYSGYLATARSGKLLYLNGWPPVFRSMVWIAYRLSRRTRTVLVYFTTFGRVNIQSGIWHRACARAIRATWSNSTPRLPFDWRMHLLAHNLVSLWLANVPAIVAASWRLRRLVVNPPVGTAQLKRPRFFSYLRLQCLVAIPVNLAWRVHHRERLASPAKRLAKAATRLA